MSAILHSIATSIENDRIIDLLKNWSDMAGIHFKREHKVKFAPTLKLLNKWADFYKQCEQDSERTALSDFEFRVSHDPWSRDGKWWVGDNLATFDDNIKHVLFYRGRDDNGFHYLYLDDSLYVAGESWGETSWFKVNDFTSIDPNIWWEDFCEKEHYAFIKVNWFD